MECTGERYMPDYDGDWTLEHQHRYLLACELVAGKDVLDIASGEGYGSYMLAGVARMVTGVDIDAEAVGLANAKYRAENLEYVQGSATHIPLPDNSVDVVSSFETIEHITEHEGMLADIKRVLRPGGVLIISSPDKHEYTDIPNNHNAYHIKELYRHEFEDLVRTHFTYHRMYGQRVVFGSVVGAEDSTPFISWNKNVQDCRTAGLSEALYLVAVASDTPVPILPSGVFKTPLDDSDMARNHMARVKELEGGIDNLEHGWKQTQVELQASEQSRARVEQDLRSILNSRSWRITCPLRALGALWRHLRG